MNPRQNIFQISKFSKYSEFSFDYRCSDLLALLADLTGFKEVEVEGSTIHLECCHGNEEDMKLRVAVTFGKGTDDKEDYVLENATVRISLLLFLRHLFYACFYL